MYTEELWNVEMIRPKTLNTAKESIKIMMSA